MTEARVQRLHTPLYRAEQYPPLPPRIRLAANCWERVWWLTLCDTVIEAPNLIQNIVQRFNSDAVTVRAQMRTCRRLCFAITTQFSDEQSEFELAMLLMSQIQKDIGEIERVEDRPADMWPLQQFV